LPFFGAHSLMLGYPDCDAFLFIRRDEPLVAAECGAGGTAMMMTEKAMRFHARRLEYRVFSDRFLAAPLASTDSGFSARMRSNSTAADCVPAHGEVVRLEDVRHQRDRVETHAASETVCAQTAMVIESVVRPDDALSRGWPLLSSMPGHRQIHQGIRGPTRIGILIS
jgi:hypothetical protein